MFNQLAVNGQISGNEHGINLLCIEITQRLLKQSGFPRPLDMNIRKDPDTQPPLTWRRRQKRRHSRQRRR